MLAARVAIFVAAACAMWLHAYWYRGYVSDDAYISLRYAQRLLDGRGLTWTDGERVEGYSNLAWILATAMLGRLGIDLVVAARLLGVAFMTLALGVIAHAQRRLGAFAIAAFGFALAGPVAVWTVGGLEAPLQVACLAAAVAAALALAENGARRPLVAALAVCVLVLTRPDGIFLIAALAVAVACATRALAQAARFIAPALVAATAQLTFRRIYYDAWLPNTAWAKLRLGAATWHAGWKYLADGALGASGLLVLAVAGLAVSARPRALVIGVPLAGWLLYVAFVGGDFMPGHRYLLPAFVLAAFAAAEVGARAVSLGQTGRIRVAIAATVMLAWFGLTQLYDPENLFAHAQQWASDGVRLGDLFRRGFGDRRPLVALDAAGAIAYSSRLPAIDMLGLCDAWIAHHPPPSSGRELAGHALGDGDYVLRRQPDLVVFHGPRGGEPMFASGLQMRRDPRFAAYDAITFAADGLSSRVFVRRQGRAGISADDPLRVPGWLFANADGNVARLDGDDHLVAELSRATTVATGLAGAAVATVDAAQNDVDVVIDAAGNVTARPRGAAPARLRAIVLKRTAP